MANWCHNKLLVKGTPEKVQEFVEAVAGVEGQLIDFERLEPLPDDISEDSVDALDDWAREHWGALSNAKFMTPPMVAVLDPEVRPQGMTSLFSPGEAFYSFLTSWYPPIPLLTKLAERFPSLELRLHWAEVGFDNAARVVWMEGKQRGNVPLPVSEVLEPSERWF